MPDWLTFYDLNDLCDSSSDDGDSSSSSDDSLSLGDACVKLTLTTHKSQTHTCNVSGNDEPDVDDYRSDDIIVPWFSHPGDDIPIEDLSLFLRKQLFYLAVDVRKQRSRNDCSCKAVYTFHPKVDVVHTYF